MVLYVHSILLSSREYMPENPINVNGWNSIEIVSGQSSKLTSLFVVESSDNYKYILCEHVFSIVYLWLMKLIQGFWFSKSKKRKADKGYILGLLEGKQHNIVNATDSTNRL